MMISCVFVALMFVSASHSLSQHPTETSHPNAVILRSTFPPATQSAPSKRSNHHHNPTPRTSPTSIVLNGTIDLRNKHHGIIQLVPTESPSIQSLQPSMKPLMSIAQPPDAQEITLPNVGKPQPSVSATPMRNRRKWHMSARHNSTVTPSATPQIWRKELMDGEGETTQPSTQVDMDDGETVTESGTGVVNTANVQQSQQPALSPKQSKRIFIELKLIITFSSSHVISRQFDAVVRRYIAETTQTSERKWIPVQLTQLSRASFKSNATQSWQIVYQGELREAASRKKALLLQKAINSGNMDPFVEKMLSIKPIRVRILAPVQVNVTKRKGIRIRTPHVPASASSPPSKDKALSGNTNAIGEGGNKGNVGAILGSCFGLFATLIAGMAIFTFVKRRPARPDTDAMNEIATAPSSISSVYSSDSESKPNQTGAPLHPKGQLNMRNQSRIIDWQLEHAQVVGSGKAFLARPMESGADLVDDDDVESLDFDDDPDAASIVYVIA